MVDPDTRPSRCCAQGRRPRRGSPCPALGSGKSWTLTRSGSPGRLPLPAAVGEVADQLLLLGVHADHRLPGGQMRLGLLVEVAELGIAVGVLGALQGLERALQPVALLAQQPPHGVVADRMALGGERLGQLRVDLQVQRNGLSGSPRVSGSTSRSNACSRPGSVSRRRLGPSCWRMRPRGSAGWSSSATPRRTVGRDASARRATRLTPPYPSARAAAPSSSRRCRSVRCGATSEKVAASTSSRSTPGSYFNPLHLAKSPSGPHPAAGELLVIITRTQSAERIVDALAGPPEGISLLTASAIHCSCSLPVLVSFPTSLQALAPLPAV